MHHRWVHANTYTLTCVYGLIQTLTLTLTLTLTPTLTLTLIYLWSPSSTPPRESHDVYPDSRHSTARWAGVWMISIAPVSRRCSCCYRHTSARLNSNETVKTSLPGIAIYHRPRSCRYSHTVVCTRRCACKVDTPMRECAAVSELYSITNERHSPQNV